MSRMSYPKNTEISYLEADINYTIFHLIDGSKFVSSFTLKKFEQKHELRTFLRVSKSYLLNPSYILHYKQIGKKATIELSNGRKVQVSRRRMGFVKAFIGA